MTRPAPALADAPAPKKRGPNTPEGKARSSMNALKHGLRARTFGILPEEDQAEWAEHVRDLRRATAPSTPPRRSWSPRSRSRCGTRSAPTAPWSRPWPRSRPAAPAAATARDLQEPEHARSLGTAIRYLTAAGMATQRAQRAFLAAPQGQAGRPDPAGGRARGDPANQNGTNEFRAASRDDAPAAAAAADVAENARTNSRHASRPRLAPEPLGHLRAPIADVPAPPAADPIGEPPHLASRLQATPSRIFPCPAASG